MKKNSCGECKYGDFAAAPDIEILPGGERRERVNFSDAPRCAIVCCNKKNIQFSPLLLGQFHCEHFTKLGDNDDTNTKP